jgi:TPR repeat protein
MEGDSYFFGHGIEENKEEAFKWYRKSAETGYAKAMLALGRMYENGIATPKNMGLAFDYYKDAADANNGYALYCVGRFFEKGLDPDFKGNPNLKLAKKFYDCREAGFVLAQWYEAGINVDRNIEFAIDYFKIAADDGHVPSMNSLGSIYYRQKDFGDAFEWFKLAVDKGNAKAFNNLGMCYEFGHGVAKDPE